MGDTNMMARQKGAQKGWLGLGLGAALAAAVDLGGPAFAAQPRLTPRVRSHQLLNNRQARRKDLRDRKRRKQVCGKAAAPKGRLSRFFWHNRRPQEPAGDTRHDRYLHSHARAWRRAIWHNNNPGEAYPYGDMTTSADLHHPTVAKGLAKLNASGGMAS